MKQIFRTYHSLHATVFDLLSGKTEVKQTTALAYLLSKEKRILQELLHLPQIQGLIGKTKLTDYDKVIVHSELISSSQKRADIVIMLYQQKRPKTALIIEAKSAKSNISVQKVAEQITGYLAPNEFIELAEFDTYGCTLTKNELVMHHPRITAISWSTIFTILRGKKGLGSDYLAFISNIKGTMKFYEKEVYSVPAGDSYAFQYEYPNIYECPNKGKQYTSMKKPLFMAFRKSLGVMERIFGVDDIIIMNPKTDYASFMASNAYADEVKKRVTDYCNQLWGNGNYDDDEKQFFILSQTNQIELKHQPRPKQNNAFRAYYTLSELLDANKKIVKTDRR